MFSCQSQSSTTGSCVLDPHGNETAAQCSATCHAPTPPPTPPPTPAPPTPPPTPMYRCDSTTGTTAHGTCVADPQGNQTLEECYGSCKCIVPHNCGKLNGQSFCNEPPMEKCNVCPNCCYNLTQDLCNECFASPDPRHQGVGCCNSTLGCNKTKIAFA